MPTKTPKRRKKVQEIPFWKLWQWMIQRSTNRNISGRFPARNHSLYTDDLALMSGPQNVTVFYTIDAYDHEVPLFMRSRLRARLGSSQYTLAFFTTATPFDADWTKGKLKNLLTQSDNLLSGKVDMPTVYEQPAREGSSRCCPQAPPRAQHAILQGRNRSRAQRVHIPVLHGFVWAARGRF